jgi:sulfur-oxidizing protein SoxX
MRPAFILFLLCAQFNAFASNDAIDTPLSKTSGDPMRGRAVVADRNKGLCLLCHSAPIPEVRQQGDLAPSLAGAGSRLTPAQLRERIVDNRRINPQSIMPAYFKTDGLNRVGAQWKDKTLLAAQDVEDVIAYLVTLK